LAGAVGWSSLGGAEYFMAEPAVIDRRFMLEREHGRGGMGTVWRAWDRELERPVALKLLHDTSLVQVDRFMRESSLLASLSHPSIVAYVAHGTTAERVPYLAMEWLDGENLAQRLARSPLALHDSLTFARAALSGLSVAHRHGVVHRDLKPSNLFLREGKLDDVVLLDLGLARYAGDSRELTRSGSVLGTPGYMAPEQADGSSNVGPASDVFALGCVLFECLTGAPPFAAAQVYALLAKLLFERAPRLSEIRPELPEVLDALVGRMLEREPARRFADAAALLAALDALGTLPDLPSPQAQAQARAPRTRQVEQELVSVILVTHGDQLVLADDVTRLAGQATLPDVSDVAAYGGELKQLIDGSLVIVLAQRGGAATDLATRAARCALRLQARRAGARFVLATGRGIKDERMLLGEAVERAGVMLRAHAEPIPPSIWLDEVTAGLLGARFRVTPHTEGLVVFVLSGEDPSFDVARPLLGRPTACVGRERELGMLELTLGACVDERDPHAVLVIGPPGIGKSRVRHEFLRSCQQRSQELTIWLGLGDPFRASGSTSLLGSAIASGCGLRAGASEDDKRALFEARVGRHLTRDRQLTITFVGELCGVRNPASPELKAAEQNPAIMADRIRDAWLAFVRAEATARPVLLVLDDLQWSDARSVALVGSALRELRGLPFLVLALGRPETVEAFPDLWAPRTLTLPLHPLAQGATRRLIRQVLGEAVGEDTVERIVAQAGGNALYLEELIRAADARRERVPETVLAMLQARIGLLPTEERRVLRAASVFGEHFPLAGVQELLGRSTQSALQLDAALAALAEHEVLERTQGDPGSGRWRFRHALMRDAAYALFTAEDRAESHGLAAHYLEATGEDPALIALHAERAGQHALAIRQYGLAARRAYKRNDLASVVELVARGVASGASGEELGILRSIEAPALSYQHDFSGAFAASAEALALLVPGHPSRVQSLAAHTFASLQLGKAHEVVALVDELLAATPEAADRGEYVSALGYAGITHVAVANRPAALRVLSRLAELEPEIEDDDAFALGHLCYWRMRYLMLLGDDPYSAWQLGRRAADNYVRAGNRRMIAIASCEAGECARRLHSLAEGEQRMRQGVAVANEVAEPVSAAFAIQYLACLLAEHGAQAQLGEGKALAERVVALAGEGSGYRALGLNALALCCLRLGELEAAERHARESRRLVVAIQLRSYLPHSDAVLLQVLLAQGNTAAAAELADEATAFVAATTPLGLIEPTIRLWIARARLAHGRVAEATRDVHEALVRLRRQGDAIPDAAIRTAFYEHVPEHVALLELERELARSSPARA
jgi:eukaryotic-like serine/threonine-protein kinase